MTEPGLENMEEGKCPVCGMPFYAGCEHIKKEGETRVQLGRPDTAEALAEHQEHLKAMGIPKTDVGEEVERAFEEIELSDEDLAREAVDEYIKEHAHDPLVEKLSKAEIERAIKPTEIQRAKSPREIVIDKVFAVLQTLKKAEADPIKLREGLKKVVASKIKQLAEQKIF